MRPLSILPKLALLALLTGLSHSLNNMTAISELTTPAKPPGQELCVGVGSRCGTFEGMNLEVGETLTTVHCFCGQHCCFSNGYFMQCCDNGEYCCGVATDGNTEGASNFWSYCCDVAGEYCCQNEGCCNPEATGCDGNGKCKYS